MHHIYTKYFEQLSTVVTAMHERVKSVLEQCIMGIGVAMMSSALPQAHASWTSSEGICRVRLSLLASGTQ